MPGCSDQRSIFLLWPTLALTGLFVAGMAKAQQGQAPPATVAAGLVKVQNVQNRTDVVGRLREVKRSIVAAEIRGKVVEIPVEGGSKVVGGETVLARIDDVWTKIAFRTAEADVAAANASLVEAQARSQRSKVEFEKVTELANRNIANKRELDQAKADYDADLAQIAAADARIAAAEAARDLAREEVERLEVIAPFDGVVVQKLIEIGEWVEPGDGMVEIVSRGQIDAVINVPERFVNNVEIGEDMPITIQAINEEITGKVKAIIPLGEDAARTFPVKIRLDDEDGRLKAGMSVVAHVPMSQKIDALTVPRDAVMFDDRGTSVWAVKPADASGAMPSAMQVTVRVMFGQGDRFVVRPMPGPGAALLKDGAMVVIEGNERIMFPGQLLMITNNPAKDAPPSAQREAQSADDPA